MNLPPVKKIHITYLMVAGYIILLVVLLALLNDAYRGKEKVFNDKFFYVVRTYDDRISGDSTTFTHLTNQDSIIRFARTRITSDLTALFEQNDIPTDFVIGVARSRVPVPKYRIDTASNMIWSTKPLYNPGLRATRLRLLDVTIGKDLYFLKVFLPSKPEFLIRSLLPLIIILVLVLLLFYFCFRAFAFINKKQTKLAELKDDFINNMTHELKTPLFTISIASKMLAEQGVIRENMKYASYIDSIQQETVRLTTLVDKVLQASKLEQRQLQSEHVPVDIHAAIRSTVKSLELIRKEKEASIELLLEAKNHMVNGDETHIAGVFYSLLDNAFKYSNSPAEITISTVSNRNTITIQIADKGIGMDADTKKWVFDRFFRAHTGNLHEVKGYGIGLSYVKAVVESIGGEVSVESKLGKGSQFIVELPLLKNKTDV